MEITFKVLKKVFKDLQEEDFHKVNKLYLRNIDLKSLEKDGDYQQKIKQISPHLTSLKFSGIPLLDDLNRKGLLKIEWFKNVEKLSISQSIKFDEVDIDELLEKNLKHILKLKKLRHLFIDVSSYFMTHTIAEQFQKLAPIFQQLDSLRLEVGENDIRDLGCEILANTISPLINLKSLQLGLEENRLGNFSLQNIIQTISKLDQLEKLQIDFWGNRSDDEGFQGMRDVLAGKKVCQSLKQIRFHILSHSTIFMPIPLLEVFCLFTNLEQCWLQINIVDISLQIAELVNTIMLNNKNTLEVFLINFSSQPEFDNDIKNNNIVEMIKNIETLPKLQKFYFEFHPCQSIQSASEFITQVGKCKTLSRLGISSYFTEIRQSSIPEAVSYFKNIINMDNLLELEYVKTQYELDSIWNSEIFEQDWKFKNFLDKHLIQLSIESFKSEREKNAFLSAVDEVMEEIPHENSVSDSEFGSYDDSFDDEDQEEEESESSQSSSSSERNQIQNDDRRLSVEIQKNVQKQTLTFENQEQQLSQNYKFRVDIKDKNRYEAYCFVQKQLNYKRKELMRCFVYEKQIQSIFKELYPQSPHLQRNFWDLYY